MTDALDLLRAEADARAQALALPGAPDVWRAGARRRRRTRVLSATGVLVVLAALVGTVLVLPGATRERAAVLTPAAGSRAPSRAALVEAVSRSAPTWVVSAVEEVPLVGQGGPQLGPWEAPGRTHTADSVSARLQLPVEQGGAGLSLDWLRADPAVTADEVAAAGTAREAEPLGPPARSGPVSTQAWSTLDGLMTVFGWSEAGGVAVLTGGGGPAEPGALAARGAGLLVDLLGGPPASPVVEPSASPEDPGSVADPRLLDDLRAFARDPGAARLAAVPLAPEVQLWLGTTTSVERPASALVDPEQWRVPLPADGLYAGYTAVPSAVELLGRARVGAAVTGPHPHCAGPPRPAPPGLEDAGRVSVQARQPTSCLDWWTVDLFVRDAVVVAVSVDLFEP